jgi:hypothetical protein
LETGYFLSNTVTAKAVTKAENWQKQADSVNEHSTKSEIIEAYVDYGVTQGYLNCMRELEDISWMDYERLSRKQKQIRERLSELLEKRTLGTANT